MSKTNSHLDGSPVGATNQNNLMSDDDAGDGNRTSFTVGKDGDTPVEKPPRQDEQNQATVEEFGREGMGVSAKE